MAVAVAAYGVSACGTSGDGHSQTQSDEVQATPSDRSPSSVSSSGWEVGEERLGVLSGADFSFADTIEEWFKMGEVTQAFSGKIAKVTLGPGIVHQPFDEPVVTNTVLVHVKVEQGFLGSHTSGDVVPVILKARSGTHIGKDGAVPLKAEHGPSVSDFESEFPDGSRVIVMDKPDKVSQFMGPAVRPVVYPDGVAERATYLGGSHPQAFSMSDGEGHMSGWRDMSYDEMVEALRAAT